MYKAIWAVYFLTLILYYLDKSEHCFDSGTRYVVITSMVVVGISSLGDQIDEILLELILDVKRHDNIPSRGTNTQKVVIASVRRPFMKR